MGLPASVVPEVVIPGHDEMDRDLRLLTQQQEKLMAEMQKTAADDDNDDVALYDAEMEEKVASLGLDSDKQQAVILVKHCSNNAEHIIMHKAVETQ